MMTIDDLRSNKLILLECISGSKAYGLDTETSDTDIKGVFLLPKKAFYSMNYIPQVNNETNDIVFYELGRFMELLAQNNPNILELLNTPDQFVLYKHPLLESLKPELFISKLCKNTFGKFAVSQLKKANGLKKKIVNPVNQERKSILSFCYVNYQNGSIPLLNYLALKNWKQEHCGLVNIPHMNNLFGLYYDENSDFQGIIRQDKSNDICLSSIPKNAVQEALLYFNKDGYSTYCKEYREYWDWVEKRNEARYENTMSHGKNYDAKNMMHVFRLLEMAIEIAHDKQIHVKRPNREFLLNVKHGKFDYAELLDMADKLQADLEEAFEKSDLQSSPDLNTIHELSYQLRNQLYIEQDNAITKLT